MNYVDLIEQVEEALSGFVDETGADLEGDIRDLAEMSGRLAKTLAKNYNKPGFGHALKASRDVLVLEAGIKAVDQGDALDARLRGMFDTVLRIGSKLLFGIL